MSSAKSNVKARDVSAMESANAASNLIVKGASSVPVEKTDQPPNNCSALLTSASTTILADLFTALKNAQLPQKIGTALSGLATSLLSGANVNACAIKCATHCTPSPVAGCPPAPPNCDPTVPAPGKGVQKNPVSRKPLVPGTPGNQFIDFPKPYDPNDPNTKGPEPEKGLLPGDLDKMRKRWSVRWRETQHA